ncbi:MAG: SDR family NAD(P)-dependent oxidoreductase, partial [Nitrospirae bacterium]
MRVALITGASGGLGAVLAKALSEEGYRLVLHYLRGLQRVKDLSQKLPTETLPVRADISKEEDV